MQPKMFSEDCYQNVALAAKPHLTVSQIERLAKAGVKVELSDVLIVGEMPEYPKAMQHGSPEHLVDMIHQRWRMAMEAKNRAYADPQPFYAQPAIAAVRHEDKVHVFAVGEKCPPQILVDEIAIFPSDALMAQLHLLMEYGK